MQYLLGIDLGTSGLKAAIFNIEGKLAAKGYAENRYVHAHPGEAEQEPEGWWDGCVQAVKAALASAHISAGDIEGIGVCGFHHCPIFLDKNGDSVRPSILTHDCRLEESLKDLQNRGVLATITALTGSRVTTGHFPAIYNHVLTNEPDTIKSSCWLLLAKDYLRFKLTGDIGTELCDATGTHLIAMPEQDWSEELCECLKVPSEKLPHIGRSEQRTAGVCAEAAGLTGLKEGTPVVHGGGDSHCALVGLGVVQNGQIGLLLGTNSTLRAAFSGFSRMRTPPVWIQKHVVSDLYTASASSMAGASVLAWFADLFLKGNSQVDERFYCHLDACAAEIVPGCDGLLFHPYILGERSPFYNQKARASFIGLNHTHRKGHLVRSVMEGVAFSTANNLEVLTGLPFFQKTRLTSVRTGKGGGGFLKTWHAILANALGSTLEVMDVEEPGCLGAAVLAGIGTGVYASITDALTHAVHQDTSTHVQRDIAELYHHKRKLFNSTYRVLEPLLYT